MYKQVYKSKDNKSRAVANSVGQKKSRRKQGFGFVDNRPELIPQRRLQRKETMGNEEAMQFKLAEVKPQSHSSGVALETEAAGTSGELKMYNPDQPDGENVKNEVGFSGILDASKWRPVGKSPKDYHRAHGYAKSFGGAGGKKNVGWWPSALEAEWTDEEQKVSGWDGMAQVAGWKPGVGEEGTYKVERTDQAKTNLQKPYMDGLVKGHTWGFDDSRTAWTNAESYGDGVDYDLKKIKAGKASLKLSLTNKFTQFVKAAFGEAESNLIDNMKMTYTRTKDGAGPGSSRSNVSVTKNAPAINPTNFGLKDEPENIWKAIASGIGIFGEKPSKNLRNQLIIRVRSKKTSTLPLVLSPQATGWGCKDPKL